MRPKHRLLAAVLFVIASVGACGDDDAASGTATTTEADSAVSTASSTPESSAPPPTPPASTIAPAPLTTQPMSTADAQTVDQAAAAKFQEISSEGEASALYVGVWDPAKGFFLKAYGDAAPNQPATIDDAFRIGSVTKTFTADVILQHVGDGSIELDGTVATYAPDVATAHPQLADLTVRQLLTMTSGIPDFLNVPGGIVAEVVKDTTRVWTADELIAGALTGDVAAAGTPGYSTTNYIV
jgi:D-alanyl-D-alanine carboxypeptidase